MMKTNQATAEYFTAFHAGMEAFETQDGFQEALDANPFAAGTKQYDAFIAGVRLVTSRPNSTTKPNWPNSMMISWTPSWSISRKLRNMKIRITKQIEFRTQKGQIVGILLPDDVVEATADMDHYWVTAWGGVYKHEAELVQE